MWSSSVARPAFATLLFPLALVTLGATACSSKSSGGTADDGPVAEADFQSSLVADRCARIGACCSAAKETFDEATCEKTLRAQLFPTSGGGAGAGGSGGGSGTAGMGGATTRATAYDPDAAAKCLGELKALAQTCGSLLPSGPTDAPTGGPLHLLDVCQKVYVGTKKVGEPCADSTDCAPDAKGFAYCSPTMHACEAVSPLLKGACGESNGTFSVCIPEGGDGVHVAACDGGQCLGIWHEGDACVAQFSDSKCDVGLTCMTMGGMNGTCVGLPKPGEACMNGACAAGAYCDGSMCQAQKDDGASCTSANECKAPDTCDSSTCKPPAAQLCTAGH